MTDAPTTQCDGCGVQFEIPISKEEMIRRVLEANPFLDPDQKFILHCPACQRLCDTPPKGTA